MSKVGRLKISNGAALILEVENGDILAMVGSKDYNATDIDGKYNVTTALRQPGSSIKPINYLLALENGQTLLSTIDDSPITYKIRGQKPYSPQNYNGKYMGRVTLKTALASSLNIPSVKLLDKNGVGEMVKLGREMGITTWEDANRFGLSLALGSGEVKMVDLAGAYSIFANMGDKVELNPIEEIRNFLGQKVYQKRIEPKKVIDPRYAFLINQALSDDQARAPIFGLNSKLKINGKTVAVKTGTTNSLRDNWCIGWTPKYLVVSWVGNNDNSPMSWVASGVSGATPIWNRIIHQMIDPLPDEKWMSPEGVNKAKVCGREEYFVNGTEAEVKCAPTGTLSPTPSP
jgi:membrane carboxypeptidase/penicillin-binding protein